MMRHQMKMALVLSALAAIPLANSTVHAIPLPFIDEADADEDIGCTWTVINGILTKCCEKPYTSYRNCTDFTGDFHRECTEEGITCRSVNVMCTEEGKEVISHAINMVQVGGLWYFIDSTTGKIFDTGFSDPREPSDEALDELADYYGRSECVTRKNKPTPIPSNSNPVTHCALSPEFKNKEPSLEAYRDCEKCCRERDAYVPNNPDSERWLMDCIKACRSNLNPNFVGRPLGRR